MSARRPIASPPDVVATVTAQRTGVGGELVYAAIAGPPLTSDQELVALAQAIDSIRKLASLKGLQVICFGHGLPITENAAMRLQNFAAGLPNSQSSAKL